MPDHPSSREASENQADAPDVDDVLDQLERLHDAVEDPADRRTVDETITLVERMPAGRSMRRVVRKYTSRDIAEGCVGAIIFMLPLLVEDGVFDIAEWFAAAGAGGTPLFLVLNGLFVCTVVTGLLYYTDIRVVRIRSPILGLVPRRLVGILVTSFLLAAGLMFLWGRLHEGDPTTAEQVGRVAVLWTPAAIGATLGDILPGESRGEDISDILPLSRASSEAS